MPDDLFAGVVPFFHTAEEASFRKAAERLGVSTAAISKAVAKLEERLGVKLLVRTSRSVALTPEGATFLASCREAVGQVRDGRIRVAAAREQPEGEVRLSQSPIVARPVVRAVPALLHRHPRLSLTLATTDRLSRLAQDAVDVAVRVGARTDSALVSRTLLRPRWVTVAAPGYLARRGTPASPTDLARHACLRFVGPSGRITPWSFPVEGRDRVTGVDGPLVVDHGDQLVEAAIAGVGVARTLGFMVADPVREGRLVRILADWDADGPVVHAVTTPERARAPAVRAVIGWLADIFDALAESA